MIQTYNEFRVVLDNKGNIIEKKQTERGTVRITKKSADTNNLYVDSRGLLYELVEPKKKATPKKTVQTKNDK
jgi:hypothetical protein